MPKTEVIVIQYQCGKCGHRWVPRFAQAPKVCPSCKRTDWDGDPQPIEESA